MMSGIKSAAGKVKSAAKKTYYAFTGKLEKAKIFMADTTGALKDPITVQFNPSEYRISRNLQLSEKFALGKDFHTKRNQVVRGNPTQLSVSLYFDTVSDIHGGWVVGDLVESVSASTFDLLKGLEKYGDACDQILRLIKFDPDKHTAPTIRFVWGKLDFIGTVQSSNVSYVMMAMDGTPVKAKVDLTIQGEEADFLRTGTANPFMSPDRTKQRELGSSDQLWMLANQEYDDPAMWKIIAKENGILNPRKLANVHTVSIPSIK